MSAKTAYQNRIFIQLWRCYHVLMELLQSNKTHQQVAESLNEWNVDLAGIHRLLNPDDFEKELIKDTDLNKSDN